MIASSATRTEFIVEHATAIAEGVYCVVLQKEGKDSENTGLVKRQQALFKVRKTHGTFGQHQLTIY